jgi:hypothetical protein
MVRSGGEARGGGEAMREAWEWLLAVVIVAAVVFVTLLLAYMVAVVIGG